MATTTLVTVQEFMKLTESDDQLMELIGGEVVTMGSGQIPHEVVKKNLTRILVVWLAQNPIAELFPETMYRLDEYNSLMPISAFFFQDASIPAVPDGFTMRPNWQLRSFPLNRRTAWNRRLSCI
jgi:Uma2 family endonuclease